MQRASSVLIEVQAKDDSQCLDQPGNNHWGITSTRTAVEAMGLDAVEVAHRESLEG